jgi:WD40 repeat protein
LNGHEADILSIAYSPDCTLLASGSDDGTVRLWDVSTRSEIIAFRVAAD